MPAKRFNKVTGMYGEKAAAQYLQKSGYKIIATNFRYSRIAEIDIIAKDKDTIVFVEVKTRSGTNFGHPFEAVNKSKLLNIYKAGLFYLANTNEQHKRYRIDIVSVLVTKNDAPLIEHLKDISLN